jgi:hypothetical protein
MVPQAMHYREMSHRYPGGLTLQWDRYPNALLGRVAAPGPLANLLDAPWILLIDLGIGAIACLAVTRATWRAAWNQPGLRLLIACGGLGVLCTFIVRSNTTRIDYAFRTAVMPANIVAAVMVGAMLRPENLRTWVRGIARPLLIAGCILGLPVGLYELPAIAGRTLVEGRFVYDSPQMMRFLRDSLPTDAVVQVDPVEGVVVPQVIGRQIGVLNPDDPHVLVLRPPEPPRLYEAHRDIRTAYETRDTAAAHQLLRRWGVTHVLAGQAEHRKYGELSQFRDPRYFSAVKVDGNSALYALIVGPTTQSKDEVR